MRLYILSPRTDEYSFPGRRGESRLLLFVFATSADNALMTKYYRRAWSSDVLYTVSWIEEPRLIDSNSRWLCSITVSIASLVSRPYKFLCSFIFARRRNIYFSRILFEFYILLMVFPSYENLACRLCRVSFNMHPRVRKCSPMENVGAAYFGHEEKARMLAA